MKKIKDNILNVFNGFCMALADSVPGVSGGTIAFLLGFYDKFITSLDDLFRGTFEKKKTALIFLIKLGIGWGIGFILAATVLSTLFTTHIYEMSSLFMGFILFAIPLVIREEKKEFIGKYKNIVFALIGALIVVAITLVMNQSGIEINLNNLNIGTILYVFFAASIAITAMVLPGISGSTMLLVFGLYIPIMARIKEILSFNFSSLPIIIVFAFGLLFGIVFFVKLIRKCLEKHRSATVYFIIGMMIASLYSIVMGPTTLDEPLASLTISNFNIVFFIIGGGIIALLEFLKRVNQKD